MINREFFKTALGLETTDIIFKQHMKSQTGLNIAIVSIQIISYVICMLLTIITKYNFVKYSALICTLLTILVMLSNYINNKVWLKAKKQQGKVFAMYDLIDDDFKEEDLHLHLSLIKGYSIKHSDEKFQKLMEKWYSSLDSAKRKKLNYKDSKGVNYHIGDIVYNPCFGDIWLIEELSEEDMKKFGFDIPYVFTQYGNADAYIMTIDEPKGFVIESTPDDAYSYVKYIGLFNKEYNFFKKEDENSEK